MNYKNDYWSLQVSYGWKTLIVAAINLPTVTRARSFESNFGTNVNRAIL
jgi:hypothetical protein